MLLLLAIAGLLVGPVLVLLPNGRSWDPILDSFSLAAVGGLTVLHLLPEAIENGGLLALIAAGFGGLFPQVLHRLRGVGPWLMLAGLALHTGLEATTLSGGTGPLAVAVIVHRLPEGLAVFRLYHQHPATRGGGPLAIAILVGATLIGGILGADLQVTGPLRGWLDALVAGMLLNIVWDHGADHHGEAPGSGTPATGWGAASATAAGLATVGLVAAGHAHMGATLEALLQLLGLSGLVLGATALFRPFVQYDIDMDPIVAALVGGSTLGALTLPLIEGLATVGPAIQVSAAVLVALLPLPVWSRIPLAAAGLRSGVHPGALFALVTTGPTPTRLAGGAVGGLLLAALPPPGWSVPDLRIGLPLLAGFGLFALVRHGPRGLVRTVLPTHTHHEAIPTSGR